MSRPSVARLYDYWLGGKDNYPSDRAMGARMAEVNPALPQLVRHNREFICAADLGTMLGELEPVGPGVCEARRWITGTGGEPVGKPVYALAAVGVKSRNSGVR